MEKLEATDEFDTCSEPEEKRVVSYDPTFGGNYKPPSPLRSPQILGMPRALARGLRGGNRPMKAYLSYYAASAGGANTAFAFSRRLLPSADSSWAAYQATFSEVKVLAADIHWVVNYTTVPTAFPAQSPNAALAYDPDYTAAIDPSSVNNLLEYERYSLINASSINNGAFTQSVQPQAATRTGLVTFSCRVPATPAQSTTSTLLSTGMWRPTADAGAYYWGAFVGYCAQGGTTSVMQVEAFVRMLCEFRARR